MEQQHTEDLEQEIPAELMEKKYVPRPRYQIVAAWVGVGIMVLAFLSYCWQLAYGAP